MYFEKVNFTDGDLPYNHLLHEVRLVPFHWHEFIEIIMVIEGQLSVHIGKETYELNKEDVIIVPSLVRHSLEGTAGNIVSVIQISSEFINQEMPSYRDKIFVVKPDKVILESGIVKELVQFAVIELKGNLSRIERKINILQLLVTLTELLLIERDSSEIEHLDDLMFKILFYINDNISNQLTLSSLAKQFNFNQSYLSRLFKKNLGVNLSEYIMSYRMQLTCYDLLQTDENISEISLNHGFVSLSSFNDQFKKRYHMTPKQFRIKNSRLEYTDDEIQNRLYNYINLSKNDSLTSLFALVKETNTQMHMEKEMTFVNGVVDMVATNGGSFKKELIQTVGIGRAEDLLDADVRQQLLLAQTDIGIKFVRFHGIFSDELMVYHEDADGEVMLNFRTINRIFDFFVNNHLKPFVEIGFMPKELASEDKTMYFWKANTTMPKDIHKWKKLVSGFIRHVIGRYGIDEVLSWEFEIWNEPDITNFYWHGTQMDYLVFFKDTYHAIKSCHKNLKVSGFSTTSWAITEHDWTDVALEYISKEKLELESFTYHIYPIEWKKNLSDISILPTSRKGLYHYAEPDYIEKMVKNIKDKIQQSDSIKNHRTVVTEWNSSSDLFDLIHDTVFMASFIVKNVISAYRHVDVLSFWTLSDIFPEIQLTDDLFYGGFGLVTREGIKKPSYYAFCLLAELTETVVYQDDHLIITTDRKKNYQILVHNFQEYDNLYKEFNHAHITDKERYNVFKHKMEKRVIYLLRKIEPGYYQVTEKKVNQLQGSAYDKWLATGALENSMALERHLKETATPAVSSRMVEIKDEYSLELTMLPHEVRLISLKYREE